MRAGQAEVKADMEVKLIMGQTEAKVGQGGESEDERGMHVDEQYVMATNQVRGNIERVLGPA